MPATGDAAGAGWRSWRASSGQDRIPVLVQGGVLAAAGRGCGWCASGEELAEAVAGAAGGAAACGGAPRCSWSASSRAPLPHLEVRSAAIPAATRGVHLFEARC